VGGKKKNLHKKEKNHGNLRYWYFVQVNQIIVKCVVNNLISPSISFDCQFFLFVCFFCFCFFFFCGLSSNNSNNFALLLHLSLFVDIYNMFLLQISSQLSYHSRTKRLCLIVAGKIYFPYWYECKYESLPPMVIDNTLWSYG
jgi:hypothetical protein